MIIDQSQAITKLNANLAASINHGEQWFIAFASLNIKPLLISLKLRLTFQLPILNGILIFYLRISFAFNSTLTWRHHIVMIISKTKSHTNMALLEYINLLSLGR